MIDGDMRRSGEALYPSVCVIQVCEWMMQASVGRDPVYSVYVCVIDF